MAYNSQFEFYLLVKEFILYERWIDVSTASIEKDNNAKIKVFILISWHEKNMFFNWEYKKRTQLWVCSYKHRHTPSNVKFICNNVQVKTFYVVEIAF